MNLKFINKKIFFIKIRTWINLNLQNCSSPLIEQLIFFHDHAILVLILITLLIRYIIVSLLYSNLTNNYLLSGQFIEIIWTVLPAIILLFIALPSLQILYLLNETNKPLISIKTTGHQWYWKYEYSNFNTIEFDSYIIKTLNTSSFRLLETDNNIILPFNIQTRILVTAADVLHAWTIPALGIKIDATPGRLNQINFLNKTARIFIGQCSEICGANHSFMPIKIETSSIKLFLKWIINNYIKWLIKVIVF